VNASSAVLQVRPRHLEELFWSQTVQRRWLFLDRVVSVATLLSSIMFFWSEMLWPLRFVYVSVAFLRALYLYLQQRQCPGEPSPRFCKQRNAIVAMDRAMRIAAVFYAAHLQAPEQQQQQQPGGQATADGALPLLSALLGEGGFLLLSWQPWCLPLPWFLEALLLLPGLLLALRLRGPRAAAAVAAAVQRPRAAQAAHLLQHASMRACTAIATLCQSPTDLCEMQPTGAPCMLNRPHKRPARLPAGECHGM
jgi:hypothetical protein